MSEVVAKHDFPWYSLPFDPQWTVILVSSAPFYEQECHCRPALANLISVSKLWDGLTLVMGWLDRPSKEHNVFFYVYPSLANLQINKSINKSLSFALSGVTEISKMFGIVLQRF